jgi:hypothetical protein
MSFMPLTARSGSTLFFGCSAMGVVMTAAPAAAEK